MANETAYWGQPGDPATKECDWCGPGSTAQHAFPKYQTISQRAKGIPPGQFIYACEKHKRLAKEASEGSGSRKKAA